MDLTQIRSKTPGYITLFIYSSKTKVKCRLIDDKVIPIDRNIHGKIINIMKNGQIIVIGWESIGRAETYLWTGKFYLLLPNVIKF